MKLTPEQKLRKNARLRARRANDPIYRIKQNAQFCEYQKARRADPAYRERDNARERAKRRGTVRERIIEKHLVDQIEARGGFCPKFIDRGQRGAPDRLVILLGHPTYYVELKRHKLGTIKPWQKRYHERLRACGQKVWVINSIEQVDDFLLTL